MAEGFLKHLAGDRFNVYSAGVDPTGVNRFAVKVMNEIGIDISKQRSKPVRELQSQQFDYVVTVCDNAKQECPIFPGSFKKVHWDIEDPAETLGIDEEIMKTFRAARDKIKLHVSNFAALK